MSRIYETVRERNKERCKPCSRGDFPSSVAPREVEGAARGCVDRMVTSDHVLVVKNPLIFQTKRRSKECQRPRPQSHSDIPTIWNRESRPRTRVL